MGGGGVIVARERGTRSRVLLRRGRKEKEEGEGDVQETVIPVTVHILLNVDERVEQVVGGGRSPPSLPRLDGERDVEGFLCSQKVGLLHVVEHRLDVGDVGRLHEGRLQGETLLFANPLNDVIDILVVIFHSSLLEQLGDHIAVQLARLPFDRWHLDLRMSIVRCDCV